MSFKDEDWEKDLLEMAGDEFDEDRKKTIRNASRLFMLGNVNHLLTIDPLTLPRSLL